LFNSNVLCFHALELKEIVDHVGDGLGTVSIGLDAGEFRHVSVEYDVLRVVRRAFGPRAL
jgi:hypothetical protein